MPDLAGTKTAYFGFTGILDPGGFVADGVYLYNHIRQRPLKVITHNTGSLSSIAVAVFVAAEERYCSQHSMFMVHPTTMGPHQDQLTWERLDGSLKAALADDQRTENILREKDLFAG